MRWLATNAWRRLWWCFCEPAVMTCSYIAESAAGLSNSDVISLALRENQLLLTEDKDFGDLVFRRERMVPGVVLMRTNFDNPVRKTLRLEGDDRRDMAKGLFRPLHGDRGGTHSVSPVVKRVG